MKKIILFAFVAFCMTSCAITMPIAATSNSVTLEKQNVGFTIYRVQDADPGSTVFITTKNYEYHERVFESNVLGTKCFAINVIPDVYKAKTFYNIFS